VDELAKGSGVGRKIYRSFILRRLGGALRTAGVTELSVAEGKQVSATRASRKLGGLNGFDAGVTDRKTRERVERGLAESAIGGK
jgi:hypothetical protein